MPPSSRLRDQCSTRTWEPAERLRGIPWDPGDTAATLEARWTGERIEVVASLDVTLDDYEIEPPVGFMVLSVAETGTIEMHVLFEKA